MSPVADLKEVVEPFLGLAVRGDASSAVGLTLDLVDQGASVESVIVDLLAPAQYECGERWARNDWSVADEHLVSGVTQRCLGAIANTLTPATAAGSVVVACAEGDWHSLPAQMFAEVLRSRGFAVAFLGASTPSDHVARLLVRDRPDALIITCNLAPFFAGVATLADAAHAAGTPVIAGGRALGSGPERALRLGADAWAPGVSTAVATLRGWAGGRRARRRIPPLSMVSPSSLTLTAHARRAHPEQLQEASESRIVIERAKEIISERQGITLDQAYQRMRRHARSKHTSLRLVAEAIVAVGLSV